jgi:hypothetical protein
MPGLLDGLERSIDRRFALYRAMSAKALQGCDGASKDLDPETVRSALKACLACSQTQACAAWLALDQPEVPLFCRARCHFLEIASESRQISDTPECAANRI